MTDIPKLMGIKGDKVSLSGAPKPDGQQQNSDFVPINPRPKLTKERYAAKVKSLKIA